MGTKNYNFSWDRGLDYKKTYKLLSSKLQELRQRQGLRNTRRFAYTLVLLTQLRNGCRVSEAVEAVEKWAETGSKKVEVKVRKKKRSESRLVVIPREARLQDRAIVRAAMPISPSAVKVYCLRHFGFNTHSLRYAFITHLVREGINPSLIAKITHHSNLNFILHYTQSKRAEEILVDSKYLDV